MCDKPPIRERAWSWLRDGVSEITYFVLSGTYNLNQYQCHRQSPTLWNANNSAISDGLDLLPLLSSSQHVCCDDYLQNKNKREYYQNCSVLCCVLQLCAMVCTHL